MALDTMSKPYGFAHFPPARFHVYFVKKLVLQ